MCLKFLFVLFTKELNMYTVAIVVGSLRKESINKKLARALEKIGNPNLKFKTIPIDDIPLYNGDLESNLPQPVVQFKQAIADADAVLFVTPEYNRSIPGVLKNVLDWGSRPPGKSVWPGKPAAMTGTSGGMTGTSVAQAHLRSVLGMLGMAVTVQPEAYILDRPGLIAEDGKVGDEGTEKFLRGFLASFADWIARISPR